MYLKNKITRKEPKRQSLIIRKVLNTADIMLYWQDKRVIVSIDCS